MAGFVVMALMVELLWQRPGVWMMPAAGGVAKVHSIQQARRILKERAKGGKRKAGDMTPSDTTFSKSAGSHHRFSCNKLSENLIDVNQVSRDAFTAAGYATAGTAASSNEAMILRTRKWATGCNPEDKEEGNGGSYGTQRVQCDVHERHRQHAWPWSISPGSTGLLHGAGGPGDDGVVVQL